MQHTDCVQVCRAQQHLVRDGLDLREGECVSVDVLPQVLVILLEDQVHLAVLRNDLDEFGDVGVVQVAQECDLAQCGDWDALFSAFSAYLFECDCCVGLVVNCFVDYPLCSLP